MIIGIYRCGRVIMESHCRNTRDYRFTEVGDYHIHSTSLMPAIPFDYSEVWEMEIDESIFINDEETKLYLPEEIDCQNYLTTKYVGRAPLEYYTKDDYGYTHKGRQFILICRENDPTYPYRVFGTEDAIRGYNRNANESLLLPREGY